MCCLRFTDLMCVSSVVSCASFQLCSLSCSHHPLLVHDLPAAAPPAGSLQLLDPSDLAQHCPHGPPAPAARLHPGLYCRQAAAASVPPVLSPQPATAHTSALASCHSTHLGGTSGGGAAAPALLTPTHHPASFLGTYSVQLPQS